MGVTYHQISKTSWRVHASAVHLSDGRGLLVTGRPGSGKTTLIGWLMLQGASLIGDDYVDILHKDNALFARRISEIQGLIAPRAYLNTDIILQAPSIASVILTHHIDLDGVNMLPFLPLPLDRFADLVPWPDIHHAANQFFASIAKCRAA